MKDIKFTCYLEATMAVIGRKWKSLIVWHLSQQKYRSGELQRLLPGISKKVFFQQLKELESDMIIQKNESHHGKLPVVTYELTDYGSQCLSLINSLRDWGENHLREVKQR